MRLNKYIIFFLSAFFILSCDGGLKPPEKSFISGKIIIIGGAEGWPSQDSVFGLRIFSFRKLPKDTTNLINEILGGNAVFDFESLPLFKDTINFYLEMPESPISLEYTAVALQVSADPTAQKVVGVYTKSGNPKEYSNINLGSGEFLKNIIINIDFKNPPPQPF